MNIFNRKNPGDIKVPEIEVRGDEARLPNDPEDREQDTRVKLPKTTWA